MDAEVAFVKFCQACYDEAKDTGWHVINGHFVCDNARCKYLAINTEPGTAITYEPPFGWMHAESDLPERV